MALCCTRTRATPSTHIVKASAVVNTPMSSSAVRSWPVGAYWPPVCQSATGRRRSPSRRHITVTTEMLETSRVCLLMTIWNRAKPTPEKSAAATPATDSDPAPENDGPRTSASPRNAAGMATYTTRSVVTCRIRGASSATQSGSR